jgi:WD40 repeat protein
MTELVQDLENLNSCLMDPNRSSGLARFLFFVRALVSSWEGHETTEEVESSLQAMRRLAAELQNPGTYVCDGLWAWLEPLAGACELAFPKVWPDWETRQRTYTEPQTSSLLPKPLMDPTERARSWDIAAQSLDAAVARMLDDKPTGDSFDSEHSAPARIPPFARSFIQTVHSAIVHLGGPTSDPQESYQPTFSLADTLPADGGRGGRLTRGFAASLPPILHRLTTEGAGRGDLAQLVYNAAFALREESVVEVAEDWLHSRAICRARLSWQQPSETSRRQLATLSLHDEELRALQFNDAGTIAVSVGRSDNQRVAVWDVQRYLLVRTIDVGSPVTAIKMTPQGDRMFVGDNGGALMAWHPTTGRRHWSATMPAKRPVSQISVSERAEVVAVADEAGDVLTFDGRGGRELARFAGAGATNIDLDNFGHFVDVDRVGQKLVTADGTTNPKVWDVRKGALITELVGHKGRVWHVFFDYRDRVVSMGQQEGLSIRRWDPESGEQLSAGGPSTSFPIPITDWPTELRLDKYLAYVFGRKISLLGGPGDVHIWDVDDGSFVHSIQGQTPVDEVLVARLASHTHTAVISDRRASIYALDRKKLTLPVGEAFPAAVSWASEKLLCGYPDGSIVVWDIGKTFDSWTKAHLAGVTAIAVGQDRKIITGSRDRRITIWDLDRGDSRTLLGHRMDVSSVAVMDNGHIVSVSSDGSLMIWDPATEEDPWLQSVLRSPREMPDRIRDLCQSESTINLSGPSTFVEISGSDSCVAITSGSIEFVDVAAGTVDSVPASKVTCMAVDRSSNSLFLGTADGRVEVRNTLTHRRIRELSGKRRGSINRIHVLPGGKVVADTLGGPFTWDSGGSGDVVTLDIRMLGDWQPTWRGLTGPLPGIIGFDQIALDPQSNTLVAAGSAGFSQWDAQSARILWSSLSDNPGGVVLATAVSPGGKYGAVAYALPPALALWDLEQRSKIPLHAGAGMGILAFVGETRLVAGDVTGGVHCYEISEADATVTQMALDAVGRRTDALAADTNWRMRVDWSTDLAPPEEAVAIRTTVIATETGETAGPFEITANNPPVDQSLPPLNLHGPLRVETVLESSTGERAAATTTVMVGDRPSIGSPVAWP